MYMKVVKYMHADKHFLSSFVFIVETLLELSLEVR